MTAPASEMPWHWEPMTSSPTYTIIEITDAIDIQRQRTQALNDQLTSAQQKDEQASLITQAQLKEHFSALNHPTNFHATTSQLYLLGIDQLNWLKITLGSSVSNTIIEVFSNRLIASRKALGISFAIAIIDNQEFAILAEPGQETKVAACLNERWQQSIATPIAIDGQEIQITTSMAVIEFQLQECLKHYSRPNSLSLSRSPNPLAVPKNYQFLTRSTAWSQCWKSD
jgi:predicted signal transduction protein with EAL and GGDEF domain